MYERRLAWRLFVAYLVVTLAAFAALGWCGSYVLDEALASGLSRQLQTTAQFAAQQVEPLLVGAQDEQIRAIAAQAGSASGSRVTVVLPSGKVIADTHEDPGLMDNHARRPELKAALAVDSDERVISINRAVARLVGGNVADLTGRTLQEVIRNADLRRLAAQALAGEESVEDDIVLRGEQDRILQVCGTSLRDITGRSVGAVLVLHDVTQYRHLENVRRDFVANVSHELKTPIASIKGFVETLLDGAVEHPDDARRFLQIVARQADRLNQIIEDLLSLSKIEQSEEEANLPLEQGAIRDILDAALNDCQAAAAERDIYVNVSCHADVVANIDARLLEQAVVNLLDNAIKYSDSGGEVLITARALPSEILISVTDHGCGIDRDHLPRLFERFYRVDKARSRKLGGTGLGLAIVKHIVQAHGGKVSVQSTPGKGSTFIIHLPPVRTAVAEAPHA